MWFKPAQQGSHPTLKPLLSNTRTNNTFRRGGEGRRIGPSRGFGGNAPKDCWLGMDELKKSLFLEVISIL